MSLPQISRTTAPMPTLNSTPFSSTADATAGIRVLNLNWTSKSPAIFPITPKSTGSPSTARACSTSRIARLSSERRAMGFGCLARRRVSYEEEEEEDGGEYGYNQEIGMLESYSRSARGEALIVHASIDEEDVQVVIFKGFSSSLSYKTSADPTRSVLPERAVIKSIDRIKGPFDPSNIHYLQKDIPWQEFKATTLSPM